MGGVDRRFAGYFERPTRACSLGCVMGEPDLSMSRARSRESWACPIMSSRWIPGGITNSIQKNFCITPKRFSASFCIFLREAASLRGNIGLRQKYAEGFWRRRPMIYRICISPEDQVSPERDPIHSTSCFAVSMGPCLLYTSPSPRDQRGSRMPSSA